MKERRKSEMEITRPYGRKQKRKFFLKEDRESLRKKNKLRKISII